MQKMRICPYCGENCKDDDHFCRYCGRDLSHLPMSLDRKIEMLEKAIAKYKLEGWILIGQSGFEAIVKRTSHNKKELFDMGNPQYPPIGSIEMDRICVSLERTGHPYNR
jgi:predicted amidophosphoribosyltransferase